MEPDPRSSLVALARKAYERGRIRHALWASTPIVGIATVALIINHAVVWTAAIGSILFAMVVVLLWRGRDLGRGVRAGVVAGIVPFVAVTIVHTMYRHACAGGRCFTACLPTCALAGLIAGAAVALAVSRLSRPWVAWLAAAVTLSLTGALGCAYLGISGIVGIAAGVVVASLALPIARRRSDLSTRL